MFKKTPVPKNIAAKISAFTTLLLGAFLFIMVNMGLIALPWLAQLIGLALLTFAIYVASAYLLRRYTFIVERTNDDEGEDGEKMYNFIITERRSNRDMTVCHISTNEIKFIREVNIKNKKEVNAERKSKKRYTYDAVFVAPRRLEIAIEYDGEESSIIVTYDDELIGILRSVGVIEK